MRVLLFQLVIVGKKMDDAVDAVFGALEVLVVRISGNSFWNEGLQWSLDWYYHRFIVGPIFMDSIDVRLEHRK